MSDTVFLYNDPHPVHERMANAIDAEFIECSKGGPFSRLKSGFSRDFGDRPVLIERVVPLLEVGCLALGGDSGPIIELAADASSSISRTQSLGVRFTSDWLTGSGNNTSMRH
jgi:hypothetical protein